MKKLILLSTALFYTSFIFAQAKVESKFKDNTQLDAAFSFGDQFNSSLSAIKFFPVTKKKNFQIGVGLRLNNQFGSDLIYQTAPAILTSKKTGPAVFFSDTYPENIDSLIMASSQNNSLNIALHLQYTIKKKFDLGFNIDLIGLSFGAEKKGIYDAPNSVLNKTTQAAKPTSLNLLLVSDNDLGMLNSELYGRYWLNKKWGIKAGATFLFTEYTTTNKLRLDNDRWRNKTLLGMIGVSYKL